jgi:hypothetical protein
MRDLPTGTVTFLFADVEGSTKLLHELGADEYGQALGEHRRILPPRSVGTSATQAKSSSGSAIQPASRQRSIGR